MPSVRVVGILTSSKGFARMYGHMQIMSKVTFLILSFMFNCIQIQLIFICILILVLTEIILHNIFFCFSSPLFVYFCILFFFAISPHIHSAYFIFFHDRM